MTVITQGEAGSVGVYGEHVFLTPSFEVDVVDTTGCLLYTSDAADE